MAKTAAGLVVPKDIVKRLDALRTSRWTEDPAKVRPMLATLADPPLAQPGLIYEPKLDGIRALVDLRPVHPERGRGAAESKGGYARLYSRNGNDKTAQFPGLVAALKKF